jgi:lysophospholipase L1-like esterase
MIIFFGDSLTSGENNNFESFVEKLKFIDYKNNGISGTCIGNYSIYPVSNNNLIDKLYSDKDLCKADKIILEYSSNDVSSVLCDYTSISKVKINLIKCIDFIKQNNKNCNIYFILLGENKYSLAEGQCKYLSNDYLKSFEKIYSREKWLEIYDELYYFIKSLETLKVIEIPLLQRDEIDLDGMHPNDKGYEKIASYLKEILG